MTMIKIVPRPPPIIMVGRSQIETAAAKKKNQNNQE
jgi:hypothetical protein